MTLEINDFWVGDHRITVAINGDDVTHVQIGDMTFTWAEWTEVVERVADCEVYWPYKFQIGENNEHE